MIGHRYDCVLSREEWEITHSVFTAEQVSQSELSSIAITEAAVILNSANIQAQPEEITLVSYEYVGME